MKKFIFCLISLLILSGCGAVKSLTAESDSAMPYRNHQTHFVNKPYKIVGRVRGDYKRFCVLADLICFGQEFVYDDLLNQGKKQGANEVINVVKESQGISPIWFILFSYEHTVANGLSVYIQPEDKR